MLHHHHVRECPWENASCRTIKCHNFIRKTVAGLRQISNKIPCLTFKYNLHPSKLKHHFTQKTENHTGCTIRDNKVNVRCFFFQCYVVK